MNADHSTSKGYPFETVISQERFKYRLSPLLDRGNYKVQVTVDPAVYPGFKGIKKIMRLFAGSVIDFLLFRVFDYAEALTVAEQQIKDLLTDAPFIPEEFGFFKAIKPLEITDNPAIIYISVYDSNISLFRNTEDCQWTMVKRTDDVFTETVITIPNHRIAYAFFYALGVKVEEKKVINNLLITKKKFRALYSVPGRDPLTISSFPSTSEESFEDAKLIVSTELKRSETSLLHQVVVDEYLMVEEIFTIKLKDEVHLLQK